MDRIYEDNNDVSAIFFDLDNTLIQTRKGDNKACNKLVDILVREYGLRHEVASESAASFLKAFRARPDDEFYAIDEWPTHLWRNCLPNNYRHIAKNISAQWLTLRFQYLALTQDVIHLLESLSFPNNINKYCTDRVIAYINLRQSCFEIVLNDFSSSVVAQRVTKLWAPRAQLLGLNYNCKICEGVHQEALYRHVNNEELVNEWHREDYLLGLITNGPSRAQWQKIQRLDLEKYFDCVLVSGDHPWEKPDQNIFLEACKLLNVEARTCIMVGDKLETDIKGGIDAELGGTVWIPLQYDEMVSDLPDFKIQKVTELPEVLPNSPKLKKRPA